MERAAVELNGQAVLAPQAVDLEALDPLVCPRRRKAAFVDEFEKAHLQRAASDGDTGFPGREQGADGACAWAPWIADQEVPEGEAVRQPLRLRFVHCPFQLTRAEHGSHVEQGGGTVVTGIPSRYVISSGASTATCSAMPAAGRRGLGTVTSVPASAAIPQSAAADRWLSTAPVPLASTAASQRPSLFNAS